MGKDNKKEKKDKKAAKKAQHEAGKKKKGGGAGAGAGTGAKKETGLRITKKKGEDFAGWYQQVITKGEMVEYYDVSGCFILRPWSYRIWEVIQRFFDDEIKELGVEPAYFPLFVKKEKLELEKDHVEGFAPEVAWVTKSGSSDLLEPLAIRPTSETIMYPAVKNWVSSHRDLPIRLNQWTNVVRWEFKNPTPFLRTREFLWQEGHSSFRTREEADKEVLDILDLYARVYEELLAVPVIKGRKSEKEKFAGGLYTTTVEALIPTNGRAIQAATSHSLGQNFSKMFGITFKDTDGEEKMVWQNSWGLTTRSIGVAVMVHGDDTGLVLPPRVAPVQVIIIAVWSVKDTPETVAAIKAAADTSYSTLKAAGVRVKYDDRSVYSSGWKYNHWEQKGVPIRLEIGPREVAAASVRCARRDNGEKSPILIADLAGTVPELLRQIQWDMLCRARAVRDSQLAVITTWAEFIPALDGRNIVLAPWCERIDCEELVKTKTKDTGAKEESKAAEGEEEEDPDAPKGLTGAAKTLCIPMEQAAMPPGQACFCCEKPATAWTLWGRSY